MIRQRQRKNVEELYGSKFDTLKSHVTVMQQNSGQKSSRLMERDNGYTPYEVAAMPNHSTALHRSANSGKEGSRRKSARGSNKIPNEKLCAKDAFVQEEVKRSSLKPMKQEKYVVYSNDNKEISNDEAVLQPQQHQQPQQQQQQQHQHHHQHHHRKNSHRTAVQDEENDDDTDEFFELIRRTVESAIAQSIPELLNRKFRDLSSKVESFSAELKNTNGLINQLQHEIENKIGHYGEENSRHFRYLCMKSEYDKVFYQNQTLIGAMKPPNVDTSGKVKKSERRKRSPKSSKSNTKIQRKETDHTIKNDSCPCLSKNCTTPTPGPELRADRAPSSENISQKSSEFGMREVLEQIKYFCTQRQFNNVERMPSSDLRNTVLRPDTFIQVNKEAFEDEDAADKEENDDEADEWELSSDGMTPRNNANDPHNKYGGTTSRGGTSQKGNSGAGDG